MRILHVVPTYLPAVRYGGPIFAVHGLCKALVARGNHVEVFTTNVDGSSNSDVPLGTPVRLDGVLIRYFRCPFLRRIYYAPALRRALERELESFDIVHLHSVFLWPTWVAARAARNSGIPYVISPRGMLVKDLIARRSRFIKSAWIKLIEKTNLEHAAAIHLTSGVELTELERFGWKLSRCAVIPNGIYEPGRQGGLVGADIKQATMHRPFALFLGRLGWKKGLDRLLRAFAQTRLGILVIAGTDDEKFAPRLVKLARDLKITDRILILPRTVVEREKTELYASARVFVLPSYSENFGNTVLEAMQHGLPVVVTPEVGAAEIVRRSGGGLVVEGDSHALGAAIGSLMDDDRRARMMGDAGRRHVAKHYDWASVAVRMESFYSTLVR